MHPASIVPLVVFIGINQPRTDNSRGFIKALHFQDKGLKAITCRIGIIVQKPNKVIISNEYLTQCSVTPSPETKIRFIVQQCRF